VNFTVIDAPQRSEQWFKARAGRLTGSVAGKMLATLKGGAWAKSRDDLKMRLALEQITGLPEEDDDLSDIPCVARGIEKEPDAFLALEALTGNVARKTGFLTHNLHMAGCSLDGHVGDFEGIVELKAPKSATHLRYLMDAVMPKDYVPQVLHNLWVSGARWCDFLSYDDRFPQEMKVFYVRVERDDAAILDYEKKALAFLGEVQTQVDALRTMREGWKVVAA
jgi:predicted phage-related endonuclease